MRTLLAVAGMLCLGAGLRDVSPSHPPAPAAVPSAATASSLVATPTPAARAAAPGAAAGETMTGTPRDVGYGVIAALQDSSAFDRAAAYALAAPVELRRDLVIAAFHAWGRAAPEAALAAADAIAESGAHALALEAVFSGWAHRDPRQLAETALRLPAALDADHALTKALRQWMHDDPWTAGDWILAHPPAVAVADTMFHRDER